MEGLSQMVFRDPDGRQKGLLFGGLAFVCLLAWVYSGVVLDGPHLLFCFGLAFAFAGVAESVPPERRRTAGVLRLVGLGIAVVTLVLLVSVPAVVL